MNVPFTAVHFSAYETAKRFLAAEDDEGLYVQLLAGGAAGGLSAAVTNPLDVLKTRMQTDGTLRQYRGAGSSSVVRFSSCDCHVQLLICMIWLFRLTAAPSVKLDSEFVDFGYMPEARMRLSAMVFYKMRGRDHPTCV